jgi:uncharacterized LabA/DUF88 family protein
MEKVCIFIDGANFFFSLVGNELSADIDFNKLANKLCGGRELQRIYYYDAPIPSKMDAARAKKQQRFFTRLDYFDYLEKKIRRGSMKPKMVRCRKCKKDYKVWVQKGVDVHLAVDLVALGGLRFYDTGIVISGDGDLEPAFRRAKDFGRHIELAFFPERSRKLQSACDKFIGFSEDFLKDCY